MEKVDNAALRQVADLAKRQLELARALETFEQRAKDIAAELRQVQEIDLPLAMAEVGMQAFTLETGEKITIKSDVYASVPKERREEAWNWLDGHGFGDLIKTTVETKFGKGELEQARGLVGELMEKGLHPALEQGVHPSTLRAWLREQLAEGKNVPLDLFGAREVTKSIIK
jgi:hypothetical protein